MTTFLSGLVEAGADDVRVVFGDDRPPVSAARLAAAGQDLFSCQADIDRVGVLMTNDRPTVEVVVGAILNGGNLVSLPLPGRGVDMAVYGGFIKDVCRTQRLAEVVVADHYAGLLEGIGLDVRRHSEIHQRPLAAPSDAGLTLVQFTSGSTGLPRPVVVDDGLLGANVSAILDTLRPQPGDTLVSWLPLAHDMGLVGMLLTGLAAGGRRWAGGGDIVLLDPATFLRDPSSWLEAVDHWRGSFTASPDFGYRLALRRAPAGHLDLSSLRCAIVGGEIVRADTLASFASAYERHGLCSRALCPAYGMSEACLAVAMTRPDQDWRVRSVSTSALADETIQSATQNDDTTLLVASGQPLPGYDVDCSSAGNVEAIVIGGPSIGVDGTSGQDLVDADGWYRTGDVGFMDDGWLYVCGREDDYLVAHGRNIYGPAVEAAVGDVSCVRPGRVTAVGLPTGEWTIVAEADIEESPSRGEMRTLRQRIRRAAVSVASVKPDAVVLVRPGRLPLTSSGKLQRNLARTLLSKGDLVSIDGGQ